jgi:hypothetical protein
LSAKVEVEVEGEFVYGGGGGDSGTLEGVSSGGASLKAGSTSSPAKKGSELGL